MTADEVSDLEARISSGHPLFGSRLKLTRAFHHVQHLREVFGGYIASEPIKVSGRTEESTGDFVYYVDHYEPIDPYVSTLIGDIYHNIRAAFDYMASALVVSNDGVIDHRTCFPICTSAEKFQLDAARGLAGASIKAIAAVESLQPYISENNLQMQLIQKINNFDKHRMIIPLVAGTKSIGFNPSDAFSDFFGEYVDLGWIHMTPRERQLPLNVGDRVFGIAKGARESSKGQKFSFSIDFVFGDIPDVFGSNIGNVIDNSILHAASAINVIADEVFTEGVSGSA